MQMVMATIIPKAQESLRGEIHPYILICKLFLNTLYLFS